MEGYHLESEKTMVKRMVVLAGVALVVCALVLVRLYSMQSQRSEADDLLTANRFQMALATDEYGKAEGLYESIRSSRVRDEAAKQAQLAFQTRFEAEIQRMESDATVDSSHVVYALTQAMTCKPVASVAAEYEKRIQASAGYAAQMKNKEKTLEQEAEAQLAQAALDRKNSPPKVGMTREELLGCGWGKPTTRYRIETAAGNGEQFIYEGKGNVDMMGDVVTVVRVLQDGTK